jgi:hypothetical protein
VNKNLPTRKLREHPDLDQLKRQAKELLEAFRSGNANALAEVNAHYRDADAANFALHDAQLVLARSYGFDSWPKLKAYVDGTTVKRLAEAVRSDDVEQARAILKMRPELVRMDIDNHQVLHFAVLNCAPGMVRVLMEHGANAREGVYPHRDATSPLTIARERGYSEIVAIIEEEESRRRQAKSGLAAAPAPDELFKTIASGNNDEAIAMIDANPALIHTCTQAGLTPLHLAAHRLNERMVEWLINHGADVKRRREGDQTPLDLAAAQWWGDDIVQRFRVVAALLRRGGAEVTGRAAVALGETDWLRARHGEGALINPIDDSGGMLRIAANPQSAGGTRAASRFRIRSGRTDALGRRRRGRVHVGHAPVSLRGIGQIRDGGVAAQLRCRS